MNFQKNVVRANEFVLENARGETCAKLEVSDEGEPCFSLSGRDGKRRIRIALEDDAPIAEFFDREGNTRLLIEVNREGPWVQFADKNGNSRLLLAQDTDSGPSIKMTDADDLTRMAVSLDDDEPRIYLFDKNDNRFVSLAVTKEEIGLGVSDEFGNPQITMSVTEGEPGLELMLGKSVVKTERGHVGFSGDETFESRIVYAPNALELASAGRLAEVGYMEPAGSEQNDAPRFSVWLNDDGCGLSMSDGAGKERTTLLTSNGNQGLIFMDDDGNPCSVLGVTDEHAALNLLSPSTNAEITLEAGDENAALLLMRNQTAAAGISVINNNPSLMLLGKETL